MTEEQKNKQGEESNLWISYCIYLRKQLVFIIGFIIMLSIMIANIINPEISRSTTLSWFIPGAIIMFIGIFIMWKSTRRKG